MSVELPEAYILSKQMNKELQGKQIKSCELCNYQKLQKMGFVNKRISDFDGLIGGRIISVLSRGNVIRVKVDNDMNLLLAPEYGGRILYHKKGGDIPAKFNLKLSFRDDTALTVELAGMGVIHALKDDELASSYVYKRDFLSAVPSPTDGKEFTFERFTKELAENNANIKSAIVGKDAVVVGLSNNAFQDVTYRAKIHPKRKASSLSENERLALHNAIKFVVKNRIVAGGKTQFVDLYGNPGNYVPAMGPNMHGQTCPICGTKVERISLGGGQVYFCPKCQI